MPTCPVCAYPFLSEPPRSPSGGGSYEICPSCGFQFGVDDDDKGITHEEWRARWKAKGYAWSSRGVPAPKGWNAEKQMGAVKVGGNALREAAAGAKPTAQPKAKTQKKSAARKSVAKAGKKPAPAKRTKAAKPAKKSARKKR